MKQTVYINEIYVKGILTAYEVIEKQYWWGFRVWSDRQIVYSPTDEGLRYAKEIKKFRIKQFDIQYGKVIKNPINP